MEKMPYGSECPVEKRDFCIGHVQKRMGTALRNLKVTKAFRWEKLLVVLED